LDVRKSSLWNSLTDTCMNCITVNNFKDYILKELEPETCSVLLSIVMFESMRYSRELVLTNAINAVRRKDSERKQSDEHPHSLNKLSYTHVTLVMLQLDLVQLFVEIFICNAIIHAPAATKDE